MRKILILYQCRFHQLTHTDPYTDNLGVFLGKLTVPIFSPTRKGLASCQFLANMQAIRPGICSPAKIRDIVYCRKLAQNLGQKGQDIFCVTSTGSFIEIYVFFPFRGSDHRELFCNFTSKYNK
jgi:hypothetical protein